VYKRLEATAETQRKKNQWIILNTHPTIMTATSNIQLVSSHDGEVQCFCAVRSVSAISAGVGYFSMLTLRYRTTLVHTRIAQPLQPAAAITNEVS
jgi:hypothetical protein